MTTATKLKLHTMLGNYPNTKALKDGEVRSDLVDFDFVEVKVANQLFKKIVREAAYDFAELAIVTYLQARTYGKPYVLLPAVVVGRGQHHTIAYNADRGVLKPTELAGKRVGVRAYTVTTSTWVRGILEQDYGVDLDKVEWITFEDPHVAEYRDPDTIKRAPPGKELVQMLLDGELDAAVVGDKLPDPRLRHLIPDVEAVARKWAESMAACRSTTWWCCGGTLPSRARMWPRNSSGCCLQASARRNRRPTAPRSIRSASGSRLADRHWRSSSIIACVKSSSREKSRSIRCSMTSPVSWRRKGPQSTMKSLAPVRVAERWGASPKSETW